MTTLNWPATGGHDPKYLRDIAAGLDGILHGMLGRGVDATDLVLAVQALHQAANRIEELTEALMRNE
jgi:hypothetical protein